jgi:hypothetical protein
MTMAVDKRQPRQTRGDDGGGCELATDLVADKERRRMRGRLWRARGDGNGG